MSKFENIESDFNNTLQISWVAPKEYRLASERLIKSVGWENILPFNERRNKLLQTINKKHDLNKGAIDSFIDFSASKKIFFNYHQKELIERYFNSRDDSSFRSFVEGLTCENTIKDLLLSYYNPISDVDVINYIKEQICDESRKEDILLAIFSAYICYCFAIDKIHHFFNSAAKINDEYIVSYYKFLRLQYNNGFERNLGLSIICINQEMFDGFNTESSFFDSIFNFISTRYQALSNHCYLAIRIDPINSNNRRIEWDIYSKIVLYSEKFIEEKLAKGYFHPNIIASETKSHIQSINENKANFELANGGFTYKDCIILSADSNSKTEKHLYSDYSLLVLMEKSKRDESIVPCPACRSLNVRGNSYPTIGVKSWECNNILCFDKSKFNRGKRYALASLIKQEAIDIDKNFVSEKTINAFRLDVVNQKSKEELLEFLITHYSLYDDIIEVTNISINDNDLYGRNIKRNSLDKYNGQPILERFLESAYFSRFKISDSSINSKFYPNISDIDNCKIFNGDSRLVLKQLDNNCIDGAVTSPPYYNARTYSQWSNIYCYLYDMFNNAMEVYRVLKPGAPYFYNIFDYFDNERNIVFSAMGKKRMILGAYIIYLFKEIGFEIIDNIIWHKGHIQGNRSNNQGNKSPYYQAPLNCYEHIFYFRKPGFEIPLIKYPKILKAHPVVKMINGKNILGHTAPFPYQIPQLVTSQLPVNSTILDPYAGSFTTARQCTKDNQNSISIEFSKDYCDLGQSLLRKSPSLFDLID